MSKNDNIIQALKRLFDKYRIIFWYDEKKELKEIFEELDLPGVHKIFIDNNEFSVKYRILREQPENMFLLYREGTEPAEINNWLLDVQLSHGVFRADQTAIWLSEMNLDHSFISVVSDHVEFYKSAKRREALHAVISKNDIQNNIRVGMLAVCTGAEKRIDSVLEQLLAEIADGKDEKMKLILRCKLDAFLWKQLQVYYGYTSDELSIKDFTITLFKSCYDAYITGSSALSSDALVFLRRWKDSRTHEKSFEKLSSECAEALQITNDIESRKFTELMEIDFFSIVEKKIISDLVKVVIEQTATAHEIIKWIDQRRVSHWYSDFEDIYNAIRYGSLFIQRLKATSLQMESLSDGIRLYAKVWFEIDQLYRKCMYCIRKSNQVSLLRVLAEKIENLYSNTYLLNLNDTWQQYVDESPLWDIPNASMQNTFFKRWVQPFSDKDKKIFVIISDALRYEVGEELLRRVRTEDRYEASIEPMVSMLPSFTQLGMAALLPNRELTLRADQGCTVLVDTQSSVGTVNRDHILNVTLNKPCKAIKADEFLAMDSNVSRALIREHEIVYLYHNRIDAVGDKRETEKRVFEATEETFTELLMIIKKATNANVNNIIVTADHGFIYQYRELDQSDFANAAAEGSDIFYRDRRFIVGKGLQGSLSLKTFTTAQLGLLGDLEVQIPKSINRLRLKGSGSQYVHGGASLQEIVIPVIKINKKRKSDISIVDVEILQGSSSLITSGQLSIRFYQNEPVTEKVKARILRVGIYTKQNELISDTQTLVCDVSSKNVRDREFSVQLILSQKADIVNGQDVLLKLEERYSGTTKYQTYKSMSYTIKRSFTSDFDF